MNPLKRVHIWVTKEQQDFIKNRYGNFSRWVRTKIDREIGAEEERFLRESPQVDTQIKSHDIDPQDDPQVEQKQKPPQKTATWDFPK